MDFQIGYFEGQGSAKLWISSKRDLTTMYSLFEPGTRITLRCDGVDEKRTYCPQRRSGLKDLLRNVIALKRR